MPKLVNSYNKSWHTGIQSEPINVTKENENKLWWQMYWPKNCQFSKVIQNQMQIIPKNENELYAAITNKSKLNDIVRSNTHNVHSLVTPSAAPQLKHRLHPHEGI